ncbi:MAG: tetratricopeptide (TPR) repeat protein [Oceanicoccus sp.]|jgi:tetratricopeptide (TPR) repeat protein
MKKELLNELIRSLNTGQLQQGLHKAKLFNQRYPDCADGWYLASCMLTKIDAVSAFNAVNKAISIDQEERKYKVQKALCVMALGKVTDGKVMLDEMVNEPDLSDLIYARIGDAYCDFGFYAAAESCYMHAIEKNDKNYSYHYNLAAVCRFLGKIEKAEKHLSIVIGINPRDYDAYSLRSSISVKTLDNNNIDDIDCLLKDKAVGIQDRINLLFSAAKESEDIESYDKSYSYLSKATALKRKTLQYDINSDLEIINKIISTYDKSCFNIASKDGGHEVIFIIGMPRTGTTLVENILASHDDVHSFGEINYFSESLLKVAKNSLTATNRVDFIEKTKQLNFNDIGVSYLECLKNKEQGHFVDKLPFNYLYAGLIHLALPNAKIINLQRNPMDTCYAVYKQLFKDAYPFSYSLNELGHYYVAYQQLMDHWNTVIPGVIHTVNYEDIVANTESEARKLVNYCGLDWQDQCLRFYENKQASTTASATQVRRPIYNSSVGKWRRYEKKMQPIAAILTAAGIAID